MREGYKKTEVGVIPEDWDLKTIDDVVFINPESLNNSTNKELLINYIDIESVKTGKIIGTKHYTFGEAPSRARRIVKADDVIVSTVRPNLKAVATVKENIENLVCSTGFAVLRNKKDLCSKFLYQYSVSDIFTGQLVNKTVGSNYPAVNTSDIKTTYIMVPPLKEQEKIAEILSTVDSQIYDTEKLIEKSKELKKGLMQKLLTNGIGHSEFKKAEVGEIPASWEVYRFFDIIEKIIDFRGRTPKKLGLDWGNGDILALSANNVKMGKIDFEIENYFGSDKLYEKWMSGNELCKNDILMTMEAPLGNVALVPDDNKYILSQRVVALKSKDMIDNRFMLYMLMSDIIQNQFNMLSTGTTAKGINQKNLAKVKVIVPPLKEQIKIAAILSSIDSEIEEYEDKKQKLEELKKGLMQQLLTGKIRVAK